MRMKERIVIECPAGVLASFLKARATALQPTQEHHDRVPRQHCLCPLKTCEYRHVSSIRSMTKPHPHTRVPRSRVFVRWILGRPNDRGPGPY
jgi:hypothetical protein